MRIPQSPNRFVITAGIIAFSSCSSEPTISAVDEISLLENLVSTTDTTAVHDMMKKRGVIIEKSGRSPVYEYFVVGKLPGYELDYSLSSKSIEAAVYLGEDIAAEKHLKAELLRRGYHRGNTQRASMDFLLRGTWKNLDKMEEHFHSSDTSGPLDFVVSTLRNRRDAVWLAFGVSSPRKFRRLMTIGDRIPASTSPALVIKDQSLHIGSVVADTISYKQLVQHIGTCNILFSPSTTEGQITEAFRRSLRLPKVIDNSDRFIYDTLGIQINVNRQSGLLSSISLYYKTTVSDQTPRQSFAGNLIINNSTITNETKLNDLLRMGIGNPPSRGSLPHDTHEASIGKFHLIFHFDYGAISFSNTGTKYTGDGSLKKVEILILPNDAREIQPR